MRGWFDAFREAGGPTLYASQRIAANHDNILLALYGTFAALFLAFLIIIPGIRRNKIPTFVLLTASMFVLATIVISRFSPNWHVSSSSILASYKRTTPQKLPGVIGVQIGLDFFNVTLQISEANSTHGLSRAGSSSSVSKLRFNEKYSWIEVDEVKNLYQESLHRGLPYPILTIAEVLSMDAGSFSWGRNYRNAGYYASIALWSALASWILMNILFCMVPRYSGYFMFLTGGLLLSCTAIYAKLLPSPPLVVRFEQGLLTFDYGWCFWMVLAAGFVCITFGVGTLVADVFFPQLLNEVHSSWKYNSKLHTPFSAYSNPHLHKSVSTPASVIQIRPLDDTSQNRHSVSAVNWTSNLKMADTNLVNVEDDPLVEEIDRASNIPFIIMKDKGHTNSDTEPNVELVTKTESAGFVRDGLGYVNPIMWDINMQLKEEELEEQAAEDTRL